MSTTLPDSLPDTGAARGAILARLRQSAPSRPLPAPSLAAYHAGPFGRGRLGTRIDPATLIGPFEAAARGWRAEVVHARPADWPEAVRAALARHGARRIAVGAGFPAAALDGAGLTVHRFDRPLQDWKTALFDTIDAGVTAARAGIADTGTLVLRPGPDEPRTLSLVPPLHVAVLCASDLHASLPAAIAAQDLAATGMPTNLVLVTGPSKTADIQQVLAFGAHGPKALVIVLVNDLNDLEVAP
jgi:L-lactate dehydrogenase complex protein LldG